AIQLVRLRRERRSLVDRKYAPLHPPSVQDLNDGVQVGFFIESDESEPARFSREAIVDDLGKLHANSAGLHPLLKVQVRRTMRYVSDKQFRHCSLLFIAVVRTS